MFSFITIFFLSQLCVFRISKSRNLFSFHLSFVGSISFFKYLCVSKGHLNPFRDDHVPEKKVCKIVFVFINKEVVFRSTTTLGDFNESVIDRSKHSVRYKVLEQKMKLLYHNRNTIFYIHSIASLPTLFVFFFSIRQGGGAIRISGTNAPPHIFRSEALHYIAPTPPPQQTIL